MFLKGGLDMIELFIGIVIGNVIGTIAMHMYFANHDSGDLIVRQDEDGEYLFLELNKPVSYICQNDRATFRITRK